MYNLKYKYTEKHGKELNLALNELLDRSINNYAKKYNVPYNKDIESIYRYVGYVEEYFVLLIKMGYISKNANNFRSILDSIKKINTINVLNKNKRHNIYGLSNLKDIYINPDIKASEHFTKEDREKLYTFHEIGHAVHDHLWQREVDNYGYYLSKNNTSREMFNKQKPENVNQMLEGLNLVDDMCVQYTAENMIYYLNGKKRPGLSLNMNKKLYNGRPFLSNVDCYQEIQMPIYNFACQVMGENNTKDLEVDDVLHGFSKLSFRQNFISNMDKKFQSEKESEETYMKMLYNLGGIKKSCYAVFGMDNKKEIAKSSTYLNNLNYLYNNTQKIKSYKKQ